MGVIGPSQRHLRRMGVINGQPGNGAEEIVLEEPTIKERVVTREECNMKIKQVPVMKALNQYIYTDKYGVGSLSLVSIWFKDSNGQPLNNNQVFRKNGKDFVAVNNGIQDFISNDDWDKTKLYVRDPAKCNNNQYGYYGYNNSLVAGQEKAVEISGVTIRFALHYYGNRNNQIQANEDLSFATKKELDSYFVMAFDSFSFSDLKHPSIPDIKESEKFYLVGKGTVKAAEVYPYPHRKNKLCKVIDANGAEYELGYGCTDLYFLPMVKWVNPLKLLDDNTNEISLSPYLIREGKTFNVFWKSIDDAATYIVSLYRIIELEERKELYHLKDYVVDRNETILIVDGLVGNTFVFKVSAENRNGDIIAMSRGIVNKVPEFMTREDE